MFLRLFPSLLCSLVVLTGCDSNPTQTKTKPPAPEAQSFTREVFQTLDRRRTLTLISPEECELRDNITLLGKYTKTEDGLRVLVKSGGTDQVIYFTNSSKGLRDENRRLLLSEKELKERQERERAYARAAEELRQKRMITVVKGPIFDVGRACRYAAFSPDGKRVLTGSDTRDVTIWDAATAQKLRSIPRDGFVMAASFSPDSTRILTVDHRGPTIWDSVTGAQLVNFTGHKGTNTFDAEFSPDGDRVISGGHGSARIWNAKTGEQLLAWEDPATRFHNVGFSPDGTLALTATGDGTVNLWQCANGSLERVFRAPTLGTNTAFSKDGKLLFICEPNGFGRIWDTQTGNPLRALADSGHRASFAIFSPDARRLVGAISNDKFSIWNVEDGSFQMEVAAPSTTCSLDFSPDGKRLLVGEGGGARIWELTYADQ